MIRHPTLPRGGHEAVADFRGSLGIPEFMLNAGKLMPYFISCFLIGDAGTIKCAQQLVPRFGEIPI
jgi:hypothetical protein